MASIRLLLASPARIAIMAMTMTAIANTQLSTESGQNPVAAATKQHNLLFAAYMALLVLLALVTYLVWRSQNRLQSVIQADADARIEEATRGSDEARRMAAEANERAAIAGANLASANQRAAEALKTAQELQAGVAVQQERAAIAERALLALRESLKDRTISPEQEKVLITALSGAPSGSVEVWWTPSDTDAFGLARQMVEIFKKSGWLDSVERLAVGGAGNGFFIAVRDHMNAPVHAISIQNAYALIGIEMNGFSKADLPEGKVQIYIGHKIPAP